jgi:ribosome biogenesis GTPase A
VAKDFDLLDTPGVLWPKFEDETVGKRLAFTGAINDTILDVVAISEALLTWLAEEKPQTLISRYKLAEETAEEITEKPPRELLEAIGIARGFKLKGGGTDIERAAVTLLDEFRGGKLGRVTLEKPSAWG